MKVILTKYIDEPSKKVEFISEFGNAEGIFVGNIKEFNKEYYVELDINHDMTWGKDIIPINSYAYFIGMDKDSVVVSGLVESIDDDDMTAIRLDNYIFMVQVNFSNLEVYEPQTSKSDFVGSYAELFIDELYLYDTN